MELSPRERERYARHLTLAGFGPEAQTKLKASSVVIVGAGGLGSPAALYLAAAGVGRLGVIDFDRVELSNLQRQVLFASSDLSRPKAEVARERTAALNPDIEVIAHPVRLTADNALQLLGAYDVVIDGSDRLPTRYLVNDACVLTRRPLVSAAIHRFEGQALTYLPGESACYRCLFPNAADAQVANCAEAGVLGVLPGVMGSLQATEAIKIIAGIGATLAGRLLVYDALQMRFEEFAVARDPQCQVCGTQPRITSLDVHREGVQRLAAADVLARLAVPPEARGFDLVDVREPHEWDAGHLEGARHIPLGQVPQRIGELSSERLQIFVCAAGARSMHAARFAAQQGLLTANFEGGMNAVQRLNPELIVS